MYRTWHALILIRQVQASGITGWLYTCYTFYCYRAEAKCESICLAPYPPEHCRPWAEMCLCFLQTNSTFPLTLTSSVSRQVLLLPGCSANTKAHPWRHTSLPISENTGTKATFACVKLISSFQQPLVWRTDIHICTHTGLLPSANLCNGQITAFTGCICTFLFHMYHYSHILLGETITTLYN